MRETLKKHIGSMMEINGNLNEILGKLKGNLNTEGKLKGNSRET